MNPKLYRKLQSSLLLSTILVISLTFYFEYARGFQPCPLCLMQRLSAFLFGLFCLLGFQLNYLPRARTVSIFQIFFASAGLYFAARQVWIQSLPIDAAGMCMPGFEALMHYFAWNVVLKALFWGTAECGEVSWRFLGLSMPEWSIFYFTVLFSASCFIYWKLGQPDS